MMEILTWDQFKSNVEGWAESRGIYEQSTEAKQLEKLNEEAGEARLAIAINNTSELMDAIGDMAVCIVNAAKLANYNDFRFGGPDYLPSEASIPGILNFASTGYYSLAIEDLDVLADSYHLKLEACLAMAWDEIKHRKGLMVDGLFVKWDNLNDEQKAECEARGQ